MGDVDTYPPVMEAGSLLVRFPDQTEMKARGRRKVMKINLGILLFVLFFALVFSGGDLRLLREAVHQQFINVIAGVGICGLLQLLSFYWIGSSKFWYCFYQDRIVFHQPPSVEEVKMEEIRELQVVPLKPGEYDHPANLAPENYFCLAITLQSGREIRLIGYENLREAWDFLAARLPEKIIDHNIAPKEVSMLSGKRVLWLFVLGCFWCLGLYLVLPERLSLLTAGVSLALLPAPYLLNFYRFGKPASEKPYVLTAWIWLVGLLILTIHVAGS